MEENVALYYARSFYQISVQIFLASVIAMFNNYLS